MQRIYRIVNKDDLFLLPEEFKSRTTAEQFIQSTMNPNIQWMIVEEIVK